MCVCVCVCLFLCSHRVRSTYGQDLDALVVAHLQFSGSRVSVAAGLLLSEAGTPLKRSQLTNATLKALFQLMHDLHELGVVHGDPRLNNIVHVSGATAATRRWKWIDLRRRPSLTTASSIDTPSLNPPEPVSQQEAVAVAPARLSVCDIDDVRMDWHCFLKSLACVNQLSESLATLVEPFLIGTVPFESFRDAAIRELGSISSAMPVISVDAVSQRSFRPRLLADSSATAAAAMAGLTLDADTGRAALP